MNKLFQSIDRFIFFQPFSTFALTLSFFAFLKIGVWYIPNLELSQSLSLDPFSNPFNDPNAHYLFWNWLSPFIAWLLGIKTWFRFFILHLIFAIAFTTVFLWMIYDRFSKEEAVKSAIIFFALPVSGTAYYWVGTDALTLLLFTSVAVVARKNYLVLLIGVMLGMQHFEQSIVASVALLTGISISRYRELDSPISMKCCLFLLTGIILGKLVLLSIIKVYGIPVNSGRPVWLEQHFWMVFKEFIFNVQTILYSVLGLGWLAILKFSKESRYPSSLFIPLFGLLLLLPIVQDQTRVLCIISFPLMLNFILLNSQFLKSISRIEIAFVFILWLLIPWIWVFSGRAQGSVLIYDIVNILHIKLGWFNLPAIRDYWPFYR